MKRMLKFLLASLVVSILLTGCGSAENTEGGNTAQGGDNVITVMASGTTEGSAGRTLNDLKEIVERENEGYTVEITLLPDDQYYTSLRSKFATGEAPDMILVQPKKASAASVEQLASAGYLEPLDDLQNLDNLIPQVKEDMTYEDSQYAVSTDIGVLGTWYNKDIFEEYNIEVPTNWDEFLEICQILQDAGTTPIVMGDKDSFMIQFGMYQVAANQVYPNNPQFDDQLYTGETQLTDEEWTRTISKYYELYENDYVSDQSLGLGQPQSQQMFRDGEVAMTFDGDFSYSAFENADFELGFMPLPANDNGDVYVAAATGAGYAITSDSQHKEFLKELFDQRIDGESALYESTIENTPSFSGLEGVENVDEVFNLFIPAIEEGRSFYWANQAWPSGVETEMQAKFSEMIGTDGVTAEDVAESMQLKFEELAN